MKTTLSLLAVLAFAASSMAAIEFSEDQVAVAAVDDAAATSSEGATQSANNGVQLSSMAMVTQAQASGAAGSIGSMNGIAAAIMTANRGGGGGSNGGSANGGGGSAGGTGNGGAGPDATSTSQGAMGQGAMGNNAVPEPMAALVWSILALCGVGMIRVFRR